MASDSRREIGISRMTSKQAKKAYQKRSQPLLSESERRQLARAHELEKRAEAIRDRERRKKENAKKRQEKEEKLREERRRMGISERIDDGYISPRQTRVLAFLRQPNGQSDQEDAVTNARHLHEDNVSPISKKGDQKEENSQHCDKACNESNDTVLTTIGLDEGAVLRARRLELEADQAEPLRTKRKRKAMSRASSYASCRTQPVRMPLFPLDGNPLVDKKEIWVPPSQSTITGLKPVPALELTAFPLPKSYSLKAVNCQTDATDATKQIDNNDEPIPTVDNDLVEFDIQTSQLIAIENELETETRHTFNAVAQKHLPSPSVSSESEPVLSTRSSEVDLPEVLLTQAGSRLDPDLLAELVSSDPAFAIDDPKPAQYRNSLQDSLHSDSRARLHSFTAPSEDGGGHFLSEDFTTLSMQDNDAGNDEQGLPEREVNYLLPSDGSVAGVTASLSTSDGQKFDDILSISGTEAEELETAAFEALHRSCQSSSHLLAATILRDGECDDKTCVTNAPDEITGPAKTIQLNVSFGFGNFDFSTQDLLTQDC